ncbi:hypothetical protein COO91_10022 (plasmid) [Nostoc flagelliforme CCNUN1]|uniref:Uncharacterized protein n=1 Tax=Nostoc flagelliforme CCNUN1 TaxID=2038116 RepID=A0A2K8T811_9NOSO|nr:hypothetical protein COO91_10022 [Nostoc flagelliforme CCNUN1]
MRQGYGFKSGKLMVTVTLLPRPPTPPTPCHWKDNLAVKDTI